MFSKIKVSREIVFGVLVFLLFAFIFSFFRLQIYAINSWLFAMTGEIQQIKFSDEVETQTPTPTADNKQKAPDNTRKTVAVKADKPEARPLSSDKPVISNLPMTPQPSIQILPSLDNPDESRLKAFPELRTYSGSEWRKEKTVIKMATDGQLLYASFLCYDSVPKNLVTKYSESQGSASAWMDDSIEFFIMKDRNADHYYQIIASASGLSNVCYLKTTDAGPFSYVQDSMPGDFKKPFIRSEKCPEGFKVTMEIDLVSLGLDKLGNNSQILTQIVRNYRDASDPECAELQLYPTFIYADNRFGVQNHDRRAFIPVKVVK